MKKKISLLLVMIMTLTMLFGSSMSVWAGSAQITEVNVTTPSPYDGQSAKDFIDLIEVTSPYNNINKVKQTGNGNDLSIVMPKGNAYSINDKVTTLQAGRSYSLYLQITAADDTPFKNGSDVFTEWGGAWYVFDGEVNVNGTAPSKVAVEVLGAGYTMRIRYDFTVPSKPQPDNGNNAAHIHNFEYRVISEPSLYSDGEEAEVCTICGEVRNRQPLSAFGYALYDYAIPMINAAQPGQTITIDFGEWNSFPKEFMEKVAAKSAQGVTFVFTYKYNHESKMVTIPAGCKVDTAIDWYGPCKMDELYGMY